MKRGDVVLVVPKGDYAKPRPSVVIQSDLMHADHPSVLVCFITSDLQQDSFYRLPVEPNETNGLVKPSQIMVDKIQAMPRARIKRKLGEVTELQLTSLDLSLSLIMGLTKSH